MLNTVNRNIPGATVPLHEHSGLTYSNSSSTNRALFEYLNREIFDGKFPTANYIPIKNMVSVFGNEADYLQSMEVQQPGEDEVITNIYFDGGNEIGLAECQLIKSVLYSGKSFSIFLADLIERSNDKKFSYALDDYIGYDYLEQFTMIINQGYVELDNLDSLTRFLRLNTVYNSFQSVASYAYERIKNSGLWFESIDELIARFFSPNELDNIFDSIPGWVRGGIKPDQSEYFKKPMKVIADIKSHIESFSNYLPSVKFLENIFWESLDQFLSANKKLYVFLDRLGRAQITFDMAMQDSMGKETYALLKGEKGKAIKSSLEKNLDWVIGGIFFGTLPFLVGTIYQIIYDIIMLIYNVCWYAWWGMWGAFAWLNSENSPAREDLIAADETVMKQFNFNFNLDEIPGMLKEIFGFILSTTSALVENFIENAKEYGEIMGRIKAQLSVSILEGTLSIMEGSYPAQPTIWNRFLYIITQWFNIGCLLGPLVVDIVLLFCSGGTSGIFSVAAKLGKLGKVWDIYKYASGIGDLLEKSNFVTRFISIFPQEFILLMEKLFVQLWAISSKMDDQIKILLQVAKKFLANKGKFIDDIDIVALGEKLDNWLNLAGTIDLFAGIVYLMMGGSNTIVNEEGMVARL